MYRHVSHNSSTVPLLITILMCIDMQAMVTAIQYVCRISRDEAIQRYRLPLKYWPFEYNK